MQMTITIKIQDGYILQGGSGKPLWLGSQFEEQSWIKKQLEGQHVQLEGQSFGLAEQSWLPLKLSQCSHSPGIVDFVFFQCFSFRHFSNSIFTGFLQPSRHCLFVELPQHGHRAGLERHGEFLQHGNIAGLSQPGKSSSEPKQHFLPELGQQGLCGDFGDQHSNAWSGGGGINWPPGDTLDFKYFEDLLTRF